uniref:Uncharacterized protein n=1 Tax=Rhipicephalus pulchellus TaxID=72859 RepID=L7M211_RHIPC
MRVACSRSHGIGVYLCARVCTPAQGATTPCSRDSCAMAASTWVDPAGTERRSPAAASYIASPLTSLSLPLLPCASLLTTPFFLFFPSVPPVLFFSSSKDTSERARRSTDASRPSSFPSTPCGRPESAVTSWRRGVPWWSVWSATARSAAGRLEGVSGGCCAGTSAHS